MENGNGHPVTKSELQAILQAALTAQREDVQAALTAQREDFQAALTAQREDFQAALTAQREDFQAALTAQREDFQAALTAQRQEFQTALTAQKDQLTETIRDVETHLLTEFHRYAQGQQIRLHSLEVGDRDIILRLAILEERVLALEAQRPPSV